MSITKKIIHAPPSLHPETLTDPHSGIVDRSGERILFYCPRNRCGATYHIEVDVWQVMGPMDFKTWLSAIGENNLLPSGSNENDLANWIEACMGTPVAGNC